MKFYVIGDSETVLGFCLVGVEGEIVTSSEEAQSALEKAFAQKDLGIVLMPERIAQWVRSVVDKHTYKGAFPLIIEIPDMQGPMEGRKTIQELVGRAVGVHV